MNIFRLIVVSIFCSVFAYIFYSLNSHTELVPWQRIVLGAWLFLVAGSILAMPLYFWSHPNRGETLAQLKLQVFFNGAQGYFSYLLVLVVFRDLISWIPSAAEATQGVFAFFAILLGPFVLNLAGRLPIIWGPFVKKVEIKSPRLPAGWSGLSIAQISDLHIGPGLKFDYIKKVVRMTNELQPDLIFLTGDIVDHLDRWFEKEIDWLGQLKAPLGVFYISGNHEFYWKYAPIAERLRRAGIQVLENESRMVTRAGLAPIAICGVLDFASAMFGGPGPDLKLAKAQCPADSFKILLVHQPKIADAAAAEKYDVQFSGHTHAGQFIPWSLVIGLFQKYPKGLYRVKDMQLYVNQGTGFWGPPDRLGTLPEITFARLV
jgi:predicted MPP superfamily phosphohydrolase